MRPFALKLQFLPHASLFRSQTSMNAQVSEAAGDSPMTKKEQFYGNRH
jgi:hypothetical protein